MTMVMMMMVLINDDAQEDDDDGADEEDGDDSSWREDALIYMLGKLTRRRWRIFFRKDSVPENLRRR